jgi:hypothetical protein
VTPRSQPSALVAVFVPCYVTSLHLSKPLFAEVNGDLHFLSRWVARAKFRNFTCRQAREPAQLSFWLQCALRDLPPRSRDHPFPDDTDAREVIQQLTILGTLLLTSKGASGVTGSGLIVLAATLSSAPTIPVAGLALILGIDRFMSEARALTNLIGNGVATIVVSKWEKELDHQQMERGLRRDVEEELEEEAQLKHAAAKTAEKPA